jgi:hypothetical protein
MDGVLNRYGIQSEYTGKIFININIAIQKQEISIESKNKVKDSYTRTLYNLKNTLEKITGETNDEYYYDTKDDRDLINSKFGFINAFSK